MKDEILALTYQPSDLLAELKEKAKGPTPDERPAKIPLSSIVCMEALFQPRGISERHVSELERVLAGGVDVDPVTVIRVGGEVVLIDGHHRVAAYNRVNNASAVPVRWFDGTVEDAVLEAGRANSKTKLPMTSQERQDYAWRLVLMGGYSKAKIAAAAGASGSQVAIMRSVKKKLGDEALLHSSWWRAREAAHGRSTGEEMTDDELEQWKEERANRFADRLSKEFGNKLANSPEVAARALEIYFGRRMVAVLEHLQAAESDPEGGDFDGGEADF